MRKQGLFVTGTDTDVGKTWVSALLCALLSELREIAYLKPVQAGRPWDRDTVSDLLGEQSPVQVLPSFINLELAASPNRGAEREGRRLEISNLQKSWDDLSASPFYVVEGAGGILVPLNDREKVIDLAHSFSLPTVLVCSTRLGTINHTLLSVEALKHRGLKCLGLILNGPEDVGLDKILQRETGLPVLLKVPFVDKRDQGSASRFIAQMSQSHKRDLDQKLTEASQLGARDEIKSLKDRDRKFVWHPFTQHGLVQDHPIVSRGRGSYLWLDGQPVLDGISSWWVNLFGHSQAEIARAISDQAHELEHVLFAGTTHRPAVELSAQLISSLQERKIPMAKAFFSDNGSTAVEVALKMAYQYQVQSGERQRTKFLALEGAYHGDTFGAMAVGARSGFNEVFEPLFFETEYLDPFNLEGVEELFTQRGHEFSAFIFEPLVQGANGMRMYPRENLERLLHLCREHGVLTIADEIFTGFYRTGSLFASELLVHKPDLICLSKGITGGFLPLSVTLAPEKVYSAFLDKSNMAKAFLHGHSYTANPIACAAAVKTLELLKQPEWLHKIQTLQGSLWDNLENITANERLFNFRQLGTIVAMEYGAPESSYFSDDFSYRFHQRALQEGVLLRPLGNTIYVVPPYCMEPFEVEKIFDVIDQLTTKENV